MNARGAGTLGIQGQYLPKFGELINKIRAHRNQENRCVFFLVENVLFSRTKDQRHHDYKTVDEAIDSTHSDWDAFYLSPCQRDRSYWFNVRNC